jgi:hypothetical protein
MEISEGIYRYLFYTTEFLNSNINDFNMYSEWIMTDSVRRQQPTDLTEQTRDVSWKDGITFEAGTGVSDHTMK